MCVRWIGAAAGWVLPAAHIIKGGPPTEFLSGLEKLNSVDLRCRVSSACGLYIGERDRVDWSGK